MNAGGREGGDRGTSGAPLAAAAGDGRPQRVRVVVLGGGFAGLAAARALGKADVDVTVIDRRNHHLFQPLLYQVATAALNPSDIAVPIRSILRKQRNTRVLLADVRSIDVAARRVRLDEGDVPYDHLIVATGATHSYFGHDEWATLAPGLKSLDDAIEIRRRLFSAFEEAERETDPRRQQEWMTFVIVGGGATGVELAGAFAEIARHTLHADFRTIDPRTARIVLVEGAPRLIPGFDERLSDDARRKLERLGVDVRTDARVTAIDAEGVNIGNERLTARTAVWAAGVRASPLARSLGTPLDRAGRVLVTPHLTVPGHDEIAVVGDLAALEQDGQPIPGVSPAALQEGRHAAANIVRALAGKAPLPFRYRDKGSFAVIGRGAAVGELRIPLHMRSRGVVAWFLWLFIHLLYLVGFRNRFAVLLGWAYSYLTFRRGARLITGPTPLPTETTATQSVSVAASPAAAAPVVASS